MFLSLLFSTTMVWAAPPVGEPPIADPDAEESVESAPPLAPSSEEGSGEGSLWDYIESQEGSSGSGEARTSAEEAPRRGWWRRVRRPRTVESSDPGDPRVQVTLGATQSGEAPYFAEQIEEKDFDIPVEFNDEVAHWMDYFMGSGRSTFTIWLERSGRYQRLMEDLLASKGLPRDLWVISVIESGLEPSATSPKGAKGPWQFISSTAKGFGLTMDYYVDERQDPERATLAAAEYFLELHEQFEGDWYLTWAAYNRGPTKVQETVFSTQKQDFWALAPHLPQETREYVPKLLAVAILMKYPSRYGFGDIEKQEPMVYDKIEVEDAVNLDVIARCTQSDVQDIVRLNPALKIHLTGADRKNVIHVPPGSHTDFNECYEAVPVEERLTEKRHVVAPGETLAGIAQRYKVSQEELRRHNNVQNPHLLSVGTELHIPLPVSARISPASSARTEARPETPASYEIQRGDSLSTIARKFKVSVSDLQAWNGIEDPAMIRAGQTLKVRAPAAAAPSQSSSGSAPKTYTIQSGDSLSTIARRFEVSVADLQRWNDIEDPSFIRRGQVLQLQGSAPKPSSSSEGSAASSSAQGTYTVASGDTLSSIASKHGVRSSDLQAWNGIEDPSKLQIGQVLRLSKKGSGQKKKAGSAGAKKKSKIHVVQSGDTLGKIAKKYGVSVENLQNWNRLQDDTIYAGQELRVARR